MPPLPSEERDQPKRLGWHQDSGRLNFELEGRAAPKGILEGRILPHRYICSRTRQLLRDTG